MRLRVTLLHDGTNADVESALQALWRQIPAADVDVHLITLSPDGYLPGLRTLRGLRRIEPFLSRDRCDVVHAWLARPALLAALLRNVPDRPAVITGVPGTMGRLDTERLPAAAHLAAAFLADMATTWHADVADWLVRSGVPSASVAVVRDCSRVDDRDAVARRHVRLYSEVVARRQPVWRRFIRLPSL